jgi:uncharacterized membrane protein YfcA
MYTFGIVSYILSIWSYLQSGVTKWRTLALLIAVWVMGVCIGEHSRTSVVFFSFISDFSCSFAFFIDLLRIIFIF